MIESQIPVDSPDYHPQTVIHCPKCNTAIVDADISFYNGVNEEGEDYGEVFAECRTCHSYYETSQWGSFDDLNEAKESLFNYLKTIL